MIDIRTEAIFSLTEAAKSECLPRRRKGKRPHVATFFRWTTAGVRGVVLESIQCGGTRCTSVEAIQRFFNRLSGGDSAPPQPTRGRKKEIERAERELAQAGIL